MCYAIACMPMLSCDATGGECMRCMPQQLLLELCSQPHGACRQPVPSTARKSCETRQYCFCWPQAEGKVMRALTGVRGARAPFHHW